MRCGQIWGMLCGAVAVVVALMGGAVPGIAAQATFEDWHNAIPADHGAETGHVVALKTGQPAGTILISSKDLTLDYVLDGGHVRRYRIGVGRDGFRWQGSVVIGSKTEWPQWHPPAEMRERKKDLPEVVPAGPFNPLGARAIYLYKNGRDTLYRIHGTNDAGNFNGYVSSGCFRMTNKDVMDLYERVRVGSRVIVK